MIGVPMSVPDNERTIPLYEEQLDVAKAEAVTDRLQVTTHIDERAVMIEDSIERGHLTVERVSVDRAVARAPEPRQDGDTLVVSVVEERLVIEKHLFVIEELRIIRTSTTEQVAIPATVRTMRAAVEHADPSPTTGK